MTANVSDIRDIGCINTKQNA